MKYPKPKKPEPIEMPVFMPQRIDRHIPVQTFKHETVWIGADGKEFADQATASMSLYVQHFRNPEMAKRIETELDDLFEFIEGNRGWGSLTVKATSSAESDAIHAKAIKLLWEAKCTLLAYDAFAANRDAKSQEDK